jgi:UDP-2-acetamido-3-amino-2,3-dideoxy-glucuronate N-acetyltransferase
VSTGGESGIARLTPLNRIIDSRGELVVGELSQGLPFIVERFFYISQVPEGEPRGIHAHKECHQFLVCLTGQVKAMVDDGESREVVTLRNDGTGLHMPPLTWGAQYDYSDDAVLLVLASHRYDPADYIHDYDEFLERVTGAKG